MKSNSTDFEKVNVNSVSYEGILKDSMLLKHIIDEVHKYGIKGEEDTILVLANKITLRLVEDVNPTSSNVLVSDLSSGGKDATTKATIKVMVPEGFYFHRTNLSEKALLYMGMEKERIQWNGKILYLEDPPEDTLKSQVFRVLSSGYARATTVIDGKAVDLNVRGKPVIIVTSFSATLDYEGGRRWDSIRVDTSEELTKEVIGEKLERAKTGTLNNYKQSDLTKELAKLKPCEVVIPYAPRLAEHLPTTLVMRTQVGKLIDYIKSSAILHQFQREKDEQGRLIATVFDYDYARFVFHKLKDIEAKNLNTIEEELVNILNQAREPLSIKEICEHFSHSFSWIYNNKENLKSKGLIKECSVKDVTANKEISKLYVNYENTSAELPSSDVVLFGFVRHLQNQNKRGFVGIGGFVNILEEIDKERAKGGLSRIFVENQQNQKTNLLGHLQNQNKTKQNQSLEEYLRKFGGKVENR